MTFFNTFLRITTGIALLTLSACQSGKTIRNNASATQSSAKLAVTEPLTRMAFGSCNRQDEEQPLWPFIEQNKPQVWVWLGDNIYGDTDNMAVLKQKYDQQKNNPAYQQFTASTPVLGIWDDHDYGKNDAGVEYTMKEESQQLMLDFLGEPKNSPRRKQAGAFAAYTYGPAGKQVKVILLDSRYFRDSLQKENKAYRPNETGTLLGEAQWAWLEKELTNSPAQLHVIGNGIQVIPNEHPYEKWANFPNERQRLFDLIAKTKANGVILLSGDRHIAEISKYEDSKIGYPVYEVTASGMTHVSSDNTSEPNRHRVGKLVNVFNFGIMLIDWQSAQPQVTLQVRGLNNELLDETKVTY